MSSEPRLAALATAVPPYVLEQDEVRERARRIFHGMRERFEQLLPVFDNAGVGRRYSCVPIDWYESAKGWKERAEIYQQSATALLERTALDCLERAGLGPEDIDAVLTFSTTGIATPALDARLMQRLPFRRDLERLPSFGLGCCAGALGLARAAAIAKAKPERRVLLLTVELCALTFRPGDCSASNVVATALFGDGAAAALISTHPDDAGLAIRDWGEYTWPDTLHVMGWQIEDDGLGVLLSRDVPLIAGRDLLPVVEAFLARNGLSKQELAATACHPGGAKVIAALESVMGYPPGGMREARRILRDYGNMSAPTVLFILEEVLASGADGPLFLSALGPGFTAGFVLLERTRS